MLSSPAVLKPGAEPARNCRRCARLAAFRKVHRSAYPHWHNAPVPTSMPLVGGAPSPESVKVLIVGLAPGLKGANRTGIPFTGDWSGELLYATLAKHGFARGKPEALSVDGLPLVDAAITNAVRCVPPQNKPVGAEINSCRSFLASTIDSFPNLKALITLGKIAHDSTIRTLGGRVAAHPFGHNLRHEIDGRVVFSSYHCSRYNTNTGVLSEAMFNAVFADLRRFVKTDQAPAR